MVDVQQSTRPTLAEKLDGDSFMDLTTDELQSLNFPLNVKRIEKGLKEIHDRNKPSTSATPLLQRNESTDSSDSTIPCNSSSSSPQSSPTGLVLNVSLRQELSQKPHGPVLLESLDSGNALKPEHHQ